MADAIAQTLDARPRCARAPRERGVPQRGRVGVPEHLARLRPGTRALVVTMRPDDAFPALDPAAFRTDGTGFVVVTDPAARP